MKRLALFFICSSVAFFTNAQCIKFLDFAGATNGKNPYGDLIYDGTYFYGLTYAGGASDSGTVFKIKPDGTGYNKLLDFAGASNGANPFGSLVSDGTFLYGMTLNGGANSKGVIFRIKPDGSAFSKLLDFNGTSNGANPRGSLLIDGSYLYGMTAKGGANDSGAVFKIKPDGTGYNKIFDFTFTTGYLPQGSLISDGTYLYGMTFRGGQASMAWGTVFKIKPDGTNFSKLLVFNGTNGANPKGALYNDGTYLYGLTSSGGPAGEGTMFRIKTDGTLFTQLFTFDGGGGATGTGGDIPTGTLISDGNYLYATTSQSCLLGCGTVFRIKPDGTQYSIFYDFCTSSTPGINGIAPHGTLIINGGFLYGTTNTGGINDFGTLFKLGLTTGIASEKREIRVNVYPNPASSEVNVEFGSDMNSGTMIEIIDITGRVVSTSSYENPVQGQQVKVDVSNLNAGSYFITIRNSTQKLVQKLVLAK